MLRILVLIYFSFITCSTCAEESDLEWAKGVAERDYKTVLENFKNSMNEKDFDKNLKEAVLNPRPNLQIFVSSSMPIALLKNYAKEAHRYNGVLVFRGLPNNSFRKLIALVMDISDEKHLAAMQIDDEAFANFGIQAVPAIVLNKPNSMFVKQNSLPSKFDKITGSITIKAALEAFAREGELSLKALEMLR